MKGGSPGWPRQEKCSWENSAWHGGDPLPGTLTDADPRCCSLRGCRAHTYCASAVMLQPVFSLPHSISDCKALASAKAVASSLPHSGDIAARDGVFVASLSALATERENMRPSAAVRLHLHVEGGGSGPLEKQSHVLMQELRIIMLLSTCCVVWL